MAIAGKAPSRVRAAYRELFAELMRSPATWFLVALCLLSAGYLVVVRDTSDLLIAAGALAGTLVFGALTIPLSPDPPPPAWRTVESPTGRRRVALWAQAAVLVILVLLIDQSLLSNHGLAPALPLWTPLLDRLARLPASLGIPPDYLLVPLLYCVVPGALLLLLGARPPELGFARGYHTWRVTLLWCSFPLVAIVASWVSGGWTLPRLLGRTVQTTLNSGPFEEFLFRGALMTRLTRLLGAGWGVALSCVAFGALHVVTDTAGGGGHNPLLTGLAIGLLQQGVGSLSFVLVFWRTRNLLAPSILHVVTNVALG